MALPLFKRNHICDICGQDEDKYSEGGRVGGVLVVKGEGIALLYCAIAVVKSLPTAWTSKKL